MQIDFAKLVSEIIAAVQGVTKSGFTQVQDLVHEQSHRIAMHAVLTAELRTLHEIDDAEFRKLMEQCEVMTKHLSMTIAGLTVVTLEKAWNAIVKVVWGAINTVLEGSGLGTLALPRAPMP